MAGALIEEGHRPPMAPKMRTSLPLAELKPGCCSKAGREARAGRCGPVFRSLLGTAITATLLAGCATVPARNPYTLAELSSARVLGAEPVRFWADDAEQEYDRWRTTLLQQRTTAGLGIPQTLLALSGGSDKGALSAGLLNAWSKRGDRPNFDIVTGVSTGALIAPFAFLGSAYDDEIRTFYTSIDADDIYRAKVVQGLLGGTSLLDSDPLRTMIGRYVTPDLLDEIAAEHRRGRRLLVVTTNLDAERGVIWDMGAIAASSEAGRETLFEQVLLASASIPGAFQPVLIEASANGRTFSELHVDGGTVGGFFILPRAMLAAVPPEATSGAVYLLYNGRIAPQFKVQPVRTFGILSRALDTVLGEMDRVMIAGMRAFAASRGIGFALCAVGDDFVYPETALFDRQFMNALYAYGERQGANSQGCLAPHVQTEPSPPAQR